MLSCFNTVSEISFYVRIMIRAVVVRSIACIDLSTMHTFGPANEWEKMAKNNCSRYRISREKVGFEELTYSIKK